MQAILLIGLQASGKSSFYKQYFADTHMRINLDMLHSRHREKVFLDACLSTGLSFVVDNTNPTRADRARYIPPAAQKNAEIIGYYFQSGIQDCMARNRTRQGHQHLPDNALRATHSKLELPRYDEGFHTLYYVELTQDGFLIKEWNAENEV